MFVGLNFLIFNTIKPVSVSGSFRLPGQGRPRVSAGQGWGRLLHSAFNFELPLVFLILTALASSIPDSEWEVLHLLSFTDMMQGGAQGKDRCSRESPFSSEF